MNRRTLLKRLGIDSVALSGLAACTNKKNLLTDSRADGGDVPLDLRQADHCVGCKKCLEHCPQNIDIPVQMQRIDNFVEKLKQNPF